MYCSDPAPYLIKAGYDIPGILFKDDLSGDDLSRCVKKIVSRGESRCVFVKFCGVGLCVLSAASCGRSVDVRKYMECMGTESMAKRSLHFRTELYPVRYTGSGTFSV